MMYRCSDDCITGVSCISHGVFGCLDIHGRFSIVGIGYRTSWQERSFVHVQSSYHYHHLEVHIYTIVSRLLLLSRHFFIALHNPVHLLFANFTLILYCRSHGGQCRTATPPQPLGAEVHFELAHPLSI